MTFEEELRFYQNIVNQELRRFFKKTSFGGKENILLRKEMGFLEKFCLYPGKRLRPILAIKTFQAFSRKNAKNLYPVIISLELYHNYTLIHDDIYDEDTVRRGKPAFHFLFEEWFNKKHKNLSYFGKIYKSDSSRFGAVSGFIGGKILRALVDFAVLQSKIEAKKKTEILRLFNKQDFSDNFGQAEDLFFEKENNIKEKDYFRMVRLKTGELFKTSVRLAGILAGAREKEIKTLESFAENMAYIFQIKDDLLDLSIGGEKGREKGSDIKNGKKTLLLINSLKRASGKQKRAMLKIVGNKKTSRKEVEKIIDFYYKSGAVDFCERAALEKRKIALIFLKKIKGKLNNSYGFFESLAGFMFGRKK